MSSQIAEILTKMAELEHRLEVELPAMRERIQQLEAWRPGFPLPAKKGSPALRLITLARTDPEAAKAEARRMSQAVTASRRAGATR